MDLKKILIFKIGHLGDTLVALPAFWAIRENYPQARITLLANLHKENPNHLTALDVLPQQGLFDDTLTYPNKVLKSVNITQYLKLMLNIKRQRFDCLVYLMTRNRTVSQIKRDQLFFKLCGIRNFVGFEYLEKNLLDYQTARPLPTVETEVDFLLNSVYESSLFQKTKTGLKSDLLINATEEHFAVQWISENFPKNEKPRLLAVAPGSKWASKQWETKSFELVIKKLIENFQMYPIIFGGPEDYETGRQLISGWRRGANAAGHLTVRESAALLRKCELYLGNDTGTMHLAASVGVRCIAVFSAVDYPNRWNPVGNEHHLFRQRVPCEGCHSEVCFNNSLCITLTTVENVYEACTKALISS